MAQLFVIYVKYKNIKKHSIKIYEKSLKRTKLAETIINSSATINSLTTNYIDTCDQTRSYDRMRGAVRSYRYGNST